MGDWTHAKLCPSLFQGPYQCMPLLDMSQESHRIMLEMWILGATATAYAGPGFGWAHWVPSIIQGKDEEEEEAFKLFSVQLSCWSMLFGHWEIKTASATYLDLFLLSC